MQPLRRFLMLLAIVGLGAAAASGASSASGAGESVQAVMDSIIDPSADDLWKVAGTVVTAGRSVTRQPRTPAEWAHARTLAARLQAGARMLQTARPVGANGHWRLADAATPGIRTSVQIQADIDHDPQRFYQAARRLELTAQDAVAAVDHHDIPAFLDAGARIDAACEACHAAYWYPRQPAGPLPAPEVFKAPA
jgi:cytochrome c556